MMTSSNGIFFRVTGPLCGEITGPGEFPAQRPVTQSFGVFFDLRLNERLSKQPWGRWFETLSWSLWRQCNVSELFVRESQTISWPNDEYAYLEPSEHILVKIQSIVVIYFHEKTEENVLFKIEAFLFRPKCVY